MSRRTQYFSAVAAIVMAGIVFWLIRQTMASRNAEGSFASCTDGEDNDWNGRADCADPSCGQSDDPVIREHCKILLLEKRLGAVRVFQPLTDVGNSLQSLERAAWQSGDKALKQITDSKSKIQLVSFWASYCAPCVREWPSMMKLAKHLGPKKISIISVSYDEEWQATKDFFSSFFGFVPTSDQTVVLRDPASTPKSMKKTVFGTEKIPENYVIKDGKILYRFVNERDWQSPEMIRFFEGLIYE